MPLKVNSVNFQISCENGIIDNVLSFGFPKNENQGCNFDTLLNKDALKFDECKGKNICNLPIKNTGLLSIIPAGKVNNTLLLKYSCTQTKESKQLDMITINFSAGLTVCFFIAFIIVVYTLNRGEERAFQEWNVSITTPADFSVQIKINQDHFVKYVTAHSVNITEKYLQNYAEYLAKKIEDKLTDDSRTVDKCKVLSIEFAFPNGDIILKLIKRGKAIIDSNVLNI